MNRRGFIGSLLAGALLTPEGLWVPGKKLISIPAPRKKNVLMLYKGDRLGVRVTGVTSAPFIIQADHDYEIKDIQLNPVGDRWPISRDNGVVCLVDLLGPIDSGVNYLIHSSYIFGKPINFYIKRGSQADGNSETVTITL